MQSFLAAVAERSACLAASSASFQVAPIPGKGFGCLAVRDVELGERLLVETPLLEISPDSAHATLEEAVEALSEADQERFWVLSQDSTWGATKTVKGVFMTNAIPCHAFSKEHRAVFATASRFNHACDANATFRWSPALGRLTVHACSHVPVGTELTVHYGFQAGVIRREDRQRRLRQAFGFECRCRLCSLAGAALLRSERRLEALGDKASFYAALCEWARLEPLLTVEATERLDAIEARLQLLGDAGPIGGHFHSRDAYLQMAVEFCEMAASCVLQVLRCCPRTVVGGASIVVVDLDEMAVQDGKGAGAAVAGGTDGEDDGEGEVLGLTPEELQAKVHAFVCAARSWATQAMKVARDMRGEDSTVYAVWERAMRQGCWDDLDVDSEERCTRQIERGGRLNFGQLWKDAGLSAPEA